MGMKSPITQAYRNLMASTSPAAQELHTVLSTHPASPYVRVSLLYNQLYSRYLKTTPNIYVARSKAALEVLAVLDQVATIGHIVNTPLDTALPDNAIDELLHSVGAMSYTTVMQKRLGNKSESLLSAADTRSRKKLTEPEPIVPPKFKDLGTGIRSTRVTKATDPEEVLIPTQQRPEEKARNQQLNAFTSLISASTRKGN